MHHSALPTRHPKKIIPKKENFFAFYFVLFLARVKNLLTGKTKEKATAESRLLCMQKAPAWPETFLASRPRLIREYVLVRTEAKFVDFAKTCYDTIKEPDHSSPLI